MNEREFSKMLAKIEYEFEDGSDFVDIVEEMINMLEETDRDDYFGTEGYRHHLGWE